MSTLGETRDLVRSRIGVPAGDAMFPDAVLDDHINLAVQSISAEHRWPWYEVLDTEALAANGDGFTVPADWAATRSIHVDNFMLDASSASDVLQYPDDARGQPDRWAVIADTIKVRPKPDAAYTATHLYYRVPTVVSADGTDIDLPSQYVGAVVAKAAHLLSLREDDRSGATAHLADYAMWVRQMRRDVSRATGPRAPRVRPGSWV